MNILDFGAKLGVCGDAIQRAIDAAAAAGRRARACPRASMRRRASFCAATSNYIWKRAPCCASSMILTHTPS